MRRFSLLVALVLLVAACGGGDSAGDATTLAGGSVPGPTTSDPEQTTGGDGDTMAAEGDSVQVHYVGTLDDGSQFDSSRERDQTFDFVLGTPGRIAGFDNGVLGMKVGEVKTIRIEPAEAYGEIDPSLRQTIDLAQLPEGTAAGDTLFTQSGQQVVVVEITGESAVVDLNHPLAGEALTFELELMAINP